MLYVLVRIPSLSVGTDDARHPISNIQANRLFFDYQGPVVQN